jgi:26S proteasome regulatory subunit N2
VILLIDTRPDEPKVLIDEKLKKISTERAAAVPTLEDMRQESFNLRRMADAHGEASGALSGAAAAAGVLTAVDEDEEGEEEAEVPREFEYFSDNEEEE